MGDVVEIRDDARLEDRILLAGVHSFELVSSPELPWHGHNASAGSPPISPLGPRRKLVHVSGWSHVLIEVRTSFVYHR